MAADPQHAARPEQQEQMQELARKLLDLWQDHLSALAQDPTLMAQALKLMAAYSPFPWPGMNSTGGPGFAPFPAGQFPPSQFPGGFPFGGFPSAATAGAAPAAATSDAGAGAVGELRRRVAELEGRLAELERDAGKPGDKGAAKPARKRAPGA